MGRFAGIRIGWLCASIASLVCCGGNHSPGSASAPTVGHENALNIYNWADYIGPDTVSEFEKETGIKVKSAYFESNDTLETKVLTGASGFDVVFTPQGTFQRQIRSGAYRPLDRALLPHFRNLDPTILAQVAKTDPGNVYGTVYLWGTFGLGYNEKMVTAALPGVAANSWGIVFNPILAAKLAACGIHVYDDAPALVRLTLMYLGRDPQAPGPDDLAAAKKALMAIRPYVRMIDNVAGIQALANGDICVSLGNNGDYVAARRRALEAKRGIEIRYVLPKEGSLLWFTMLAIPRDAPHVANAHRFIDYLSRPEVIAHVSNAVGYANANLGAGPFLDTSVAADPMIVPTPDERKRLFVDSENSPDQDRAINRLWQKFKTGQ